MVYTDFEALFAGSTIKGLAVDTINGLLFWTAGNDIKNINLRDWEVLGPDNIRPDTVVRLMDRNPHGISVVNTTIYWTEQRIVDPETTETNRPGAIYSLDTATHAEQLLLQNVSLSPQDLSTFANVSGALEDSWWWWGFHPIAELAGIHTHT